MKPWWRTPWKVFFKIWKVAIVTHVLVALAFVWRWVYALDEDTSLLITCYLGWWLFVLLIVFNRRDILVLGLGAVLAALAGTHLLPAAGSHRVLVLWSGALACGTTWWVSRSLQERLVGMLDNPRLSRLRPHLRRAPTELPPVMVVLVCLGACHALAVSHGFWAATVAAIATPLVAAVACFHSRQEALASALTLRGLARKFPAELRLGWIVSLSVATALSLGLPVARSGGYWGAANRLTGALLFGSIASTALVVSALVVIGHGLWRFCTLVELVLGASTRSELDAALEDLDP